MTKEEFALHSATTWTHPKVVGKLIIIPITDITTGRQEQAKGEFKYKKEISDSYDVILMALKATFERVIDKVYHTTSNTGIMGVGFGQLTPYDILQRLRKTYGRVNIQEISLLIILIMLCIRSWTWIVLVVYMIYPTLYGSR